MYRPTTRLTSSASGRFIAGRSRRSTGVSPRLISTAWSRRGQRRQGSIQQNRLLVDISQLQEPDADTQSRHHLFQAILQHPGCRPHCHRNPLRRRRFDHRDHHGCLAGRAGRRGTRGRRQGQWRQVCGSAARLQRQRAGRLHSNAVDDVPGLCPVTIHREKAAAKRTSPRRSPTESGSSSTRCRRPPSHPRPSSSMQRACCSMPRFPTTFVFSSRSTAWCRRSRGSRATR